MTDEHAGWLASSSQSEAAREFRLFEQACHSIYLIVRPDAVAIWLMGAASKGWVFPQTAGYCSFALLHTVIETVTERICISCLSWYRRAMRPGDHMALSPPRPHSHRQVFNQMVCANDLFNSHVTVMWHNVTVPFRLWWTFWFSQGNTVTNATSMWHKHMEFVQWFHSGPPLAALAPSVKEIISKRLAGLHAFMPLLSLPWPQADPVESAPRRPCWFSWYGAMLWYIQYIYIYNVTNRFLGHFGGTTNRFAR